jgi:hypothetical protein
MLPARLADRSISRSISGLMSLICGVHLINLSIVNPGARLTALVNNRPLDGRFGLDSCDRRRLRARGALGAASSVCG